MRAGERNKKQRKLARSKTQTDKEKPSQSTTEQQDQAATRQEGGAGEAVEDGGGEGCTNHIRIAIVQLSGV